ncbi:MAG TPA: type IX secretion system membrane protein PorP/SprF [Bacteroidia bacterium]
MRKILFSLSLVLISVASFSQQDPQFSQNMFIKLPVNPGYAGTNGAICGTLVYRSQWVGFPGSPKTFFFAADAPIAAIHGGAGLTVANDNLGNFNFMQVRGSYSFHKPIGQTGLLGLGLELGLLQASVKNNWLAPDGTNGALDQAIPSSGVNALTYDIGLGAYYRTDQLFVGLSTSHIPGGAESLKAKNFNYQAARHYYVMAGYDFILSSTLKLRPSLQVKSDAAVTTFDANINLLWNDMIWAGVSYRLQDAIVPLVGFVWKPNAKSTLKIGYSYDLGTSNLKHYHNNTHEILLNYCIKIAPKVKTQSHINPRFLKG